MVTRTRFNEIDVRFRANGRADFEAEAEGGRRGTTGRTPTGGDSDRDAVVVLQNLGHRPGGESMVDARGDPINLSMD